MRTGLASMGIPLEAAKSATTNHSGFTNKVLTAARHAGWMHSPQKTTHLSAYGFDTWCVAIDHACSWAPSHRHLRCQFRNLFRSMYFFGANTHSLFGRFAWFAFLPTTKSCFSTGSDSSNNLSGATTTSGRLLSVPSLISRLTLTASILIKCNKDRCLLALLSSSAFVGRG